MSIEAYARFWEALRPESTGELRRLARADLLFRDPFNEIRGVDAVVHMLDRMFERTGDPRFRVGRIACDRDVGFVRWDFTCRVRGVALEIEGVSEVALDGDGLVASHIDHWDAASQVYERLPAIGHLFRYIRRRMAHE